MSRRLEVVQFGQWRCLACAALVDRRDASEHALRPGHSLVPHQPELELAV